ncbi:MAG: HAMP domain-containing protein [Bacteroidaceae bacterium]|nr:HAMP domain-containing protein [Bacteroidaceae bacterium]
MKSPVYHINRSLSLKLCLGILLCVVVVFTISLGFLFERSRRMVRQEAVAHAEHVLANISLRVRGYLDEVEISTENIEWLVMENLEPDSLFNYARRVVEQNPNVNGCSITMEPDFFPQYGRNFSVYSLRDHDSIASVFEKPYNYYEKVWYKTPREKNQACWVDPYNDFNEDALSSPVMIASYCKPLKTNSGDFIGVIATDLSITWLSQTISAEKPYPSAYYLMLGSDGHYFVHPDRVKLIRESIFTSVDAREHQDIITLGHEMTSGKKGNMQVNIDGEPCVVVYQPLQGTQWSIAMVCPETEITSSYSKMAYFLLPILIIGLLLMLVVCWKVIQHFIRPLDQLAQQSRDITDGQYDRPLPPSTRKDVVGALQNGFISMQQSISEQIADIKKVNEETEQRNNELLAANTLIEDADHRKASFIHDVSIQIRTPLNIIAGFMQVLRETYSVLPAEEVRSFTEMMKQNTANIHRMANMIFDVSRLDPQQKLDLTKEVAVFPVVQEAINTFQEKDTADAVDFNFQTDLVDDYAIHTNRLYLLRVLRELLINAKKFSSDKKVNFTVDVKDGMLRFIVEDKGVGIAQAEQEHIFAPFVKLDSFSEGLGLGLGLAQHNARLLGGNLSLDPTYTEGARFILEIPNN